MIGVQFEPIPSTGPTTAADLVGRVQPSCVIEPRDDATNMVTVTLSFGRSGQANTQIDRTVDFAMSRYEDLLRRLAD